MKNIRSFCLCLVVFFLFDCEGSSPSKEDYDRIELPSGRQIEVIEFGLKAGLKIENLFTIKSKDFSNVYFIAGQITGPGMNNVIGVWATGGKYETSLTHSVNHIAAEFSDYPLGSGTKAEISMNDDGAKIVEQYVRDKVQ